MEEQMTFKELLNKYQNIPVKIYVWKFPEEDKCGIYEIEEIDEYYETTEEVIEDTEDEFFVGEAIIVYNNEKNIKKVFYHTEEHNLTFDEILKKYGNKEFREEK